MQMGSPPAAFMRAEMWYRLLPLTGTSCSRRASLRRKFSSRTQVPPSFSSVQYAEISSSIVQAAYVQPTGRPLSSSWEKSPFCTRFSPASAVTGRHSASSSARSRVQSFFFILKTSRHTKVLPRSSGNASSMWWMFICAPSKASSTTSKRAGRSSPPVFII